jgi:hypothetical protein
MTICVGNARDGACRAVRHDHNDLQVQTVGLGLVGAEGQNAARVTINGE